MSLLNHYVIDIPNILHNSSKNYPIDYFGWIILQRTIIGPVWDKDERL